MAPDPLKQLDISLCLEVNSPSHWPILSLVGRCFVAQTSPAAHFPDSCLQAFPLALRVPCTASEAGRSVGQGFESSLYLDQEKLIFLVLQVPPALSHAAAEGSPRCRLFVGSPIL